jgi:putative glutamine amidotransferase
MTEQNMFPVVTATYLYAASFATAFEMNVPSVATYSRKDGIAYSWDLLETAKLVIFTGGEDINPAIYGQANKYSRFNPLRDTAEIEVLRRALDMNKKILGVCRGHQLINAYLGGILVQDIGVQLNTIHDSDHNLEIVDAGGVIPNLFQFDVNSIHHQGVVKPGEGLTPTTYWKGIYESTESRDILTVQFHPEWMEDINNTSKLSLWSYLNVWAHLTTGETIYV